MKKTILASLFAGMVAFGANASDGGLYGETETYTNRVRYNTTVTYAEPVVQPRTEYVATCNACAQPVRVKTHT